MIDSIRFITVFLPMVILNIAGLYFVSQILELKIGKKRFFYKISLVMPLFALIESFIGCVLNFQVSIPIRITLYFSYTIFFMLEMVVLSRMIDRRSTIHKTLLCSAFILLVDNVVEIVAVFLLYLVINVMGAENLLPITNQVVPFLMYVVINSFVFGVFFCLLRGKFAVYMRSVLENRASSLKLFFLTLGFEWGFYVILHMQTKTFMRDFMIIGILAVVLSLVLFFWYFYSKDRDQATKLEHSKLLLLQQQSYTDHLEQIQNELRGVQHDYKNLITGLYVHAQEGDVQHVQSYIEKTLFNVDAGIQDQIKWSNQLVQIKSGELKSLLLSKMLIAKQKNVVFNLEVSSVVDEIKMETGDFIRCVGILLDNAIEAAEKETAEKRVDILLMKEQRRLQLVIKNPCTTTVDIANIRNRGITTKGAGRGLGLSIYKEIVGKYVNVLSETKQQKNEFIQELAIFESA